MSPSAERPSATAPRVAADADGRGLRHGGSGADVHPSRRRLSRLVGHQSKIDGLWNLQMIPSLALRACVTRQADFFSDLVASFPGTTSREEPTALTEAPRMTQPRFDPVLEQIRKLAADQQAAQLSDGELLE